MSHVLHIMTNADKEYSCLPSPSLTTYQLNTCRHLKITPFIPWVQSNAHSVVPVTNKRNGRSLHLPKILAIFL